MDLWLKILILFGELLQFYANFPFLIFSAFSIANSLCLDEKTDIFIFFELRRCPDLVF